jgi:hypothetical protein
MTTITLDLPDDLAKQLQKFDIQTLIKLLRQLLSFHPAESDETDSPELPEQDETAYLLQSDAMRERLLTAINSEDGIPFDNKSIKTFGDLLEHGYGLWADRDDIDHPLEYATRLRQDIWQRVP